MIPYLQNIKHDKWESVFVFLLRSDQQREACKAEPEGLFFAHVGAGHTYLEAWNPAQTESFENTILPGMKTILQTSFGFSEGPGMSLGCFPIFE